MQRKELLKIVLESDFTSANEYIEAERANKKYAAQLKKWNTDRAKYLSLNKGTIEEKVDIRFEWHVNNRKDHDNIAFAKKFILDGLQKSGVLKNDNPKYVGNFEDIFFKSRKEYVTLYFYKHKEE